MRLAGACASGCARDALWAVARRVGSAHAAAAETLRVASKAFTESVILAEIVTQLERVRGRRGRAPRRARRHAARSGTRCSQAPSTSIRSTRGTLLDEILAADRQPVAGADRAATRLARARARRARRGHDRAARLQQHVRHRRARRSARGRSGIAEISDLRAHPELRFGFSNEFMSRHDGWPALRERYGLPQTNVAGPRPRSRVSRARGAAPSTPRICTRPTRRSVATSCAARGRPAVLPALRRRLAVPARSARRASASALAALRRLQGRIDARADGRAERARQARPRAGDRGRGRLPARRHSASPRASRREPSASRAHARRASREHLLAGRRRRCSAAILVAIPLGIIAARRAAAGPGRARPSWASSRRCRRSALLVFMIPLLRASAALPAVVALFLVQPAARSSATRTPG